ncbi:MAG: PilZ domain-containing protein [Planctomycetota bacterium]|nr:PilZ domain-containing protein [Planctomycetota bacterium]
MSRDPMDSSNEKAEYREFHRVAHRFGIQCRRVGVDVLPARVDLIDIGEGGARLHSDFPVENGSRMLLDFKRPEHGLDQTLHAQVMWVRSDPENTSWDWGVRFQESESFAIQQLFEKLSNTSEVPIPAPQIIQKQPEERRGAVRIHENCPIRFAKSPAGWLTSWTPSTALDVSGSGIAFISKRPPEPGTMLEVEIQLQDEPIRPQITGVVARCEALPGGEYRVGLQFIQMDDTSQKQLSSYLSRRLRERLDRG